MFTLEVDLLTGRYAATAHDDRSRAEWPPHPARVFSALVAAHYEGERTPAERAALLWLEAQPAPALEFAEATERDVHDVFVPVNDVSAVGDLERPLRERSEALEQLRQAGADGATLARAERHVARARTALAEDLEALGQADLTPSGEPLKRAAALLPERRTRQMRTFPVALPASPRFAFGWSADPPPDVLAALEQLCARVTRLGHSSSLVWCRSSARALIPTLVPRDDGDVVLRAVSSGQLERLDRAFERHQGIAGRTLPATSQRYGPPVTEPTLIAQGHFASDGWIVFERVAGGRPLAPKVTELSRALRAALLEQHGGAAMPPALSGHDAAGRPVTTPHVAFIGLPWVGDEHADGSLKGCAIIPPRALSDPDRRELLRLVAQWELTRSENSRLTLAGPALPPIQVQRVQVASMKTTRAALWTRASTRFVSATAIALDRNPGNLRSNLDRTAHKAALEAEESIAESCVNIGLPRPRSVRVSLDPFLRGLPPARAFRPLPARPGRPPRVRVHAVIDFESPVRGPILLGAGRYFGLGLCLPLEVRL